LSAEKKEICVKNTDSQASGIFLAPAPAADRNDVRPEGPILSAQAAGLGRPASRHFRPEGPVRSGVHPAAERPFQGRRLPPLFTQAFGLG
jgi:hypothetical protein